MSTSLAVPQPTGVEIEKVLVGGDLSKLSPDQRVLYYNNVCHSIGLNPLTRPFSYLNLNNKLVLYATKDCADQLRAIKGVSITKLEREEAEGLYIVTAYAALATGRQDSDLGAVTIAKLTGDARANAIMKATTKAKRRVTLSICGLGFLDETEIETIPGAYQVSVAETGEIAPHQDSGKDAGSLPAERSATPYSPSGEAAQAAGAVKSPDTPSVPPEVQALWDRATTDGKLTKAGVSEIVEELRSTLWEMIGEQAQQEVVACKNAFGDPCAKGGFFKRYVLEMWKRIQYHKSQIITDDDIPAIIGDPK